MRKPCLGLFIVCCALRCWSAEEGLYQSFLKTVGTNVLLPIAIKSPFFVDTNNTAPKVANSMVDLNKMKTDGEIAGVRLGMTMEEVAACWGKPMWMWSRCNGGPFFGFRDANVVFATNSNRVKLILLKNVRALHFENGLNASSNTNDLNRVLGAPARRTDSKFGFHFLYETSRGTLDLEFDPEEENFPGYTHLTGIRVIATESAAEFGKPK